MEQKKKKSVRQAPKRDRMTNEKALRILSVSFDGVNQEMQRMMKRMDQLESMMLDDFSKKETMKEQVTNQEPLDGKALEATRPWKIAVSKVLDELSVLRNKLDDINGFTEPIQTTVKDKDPKADLPEALGNSPVLQDMSEILYRIHYLSVYVSTIKANMYI